MLYYLLFSNSNPRKINFAKVDVCLYCFMFSRLSHRININGLHRGARISTLDIFLSFSRLEPAVFRSNDHLWRARFDASVYG